MNVAWQTVSPAPSPQPQAADELLREVLTTSEVFNDLLEPAAKNDEPVLLIVNDPHRATQTRPALRALAELVAGTAVRTGVPAETSVGPAKALARVPRFRAIVATGIHCFPQRERRNFEETTFAGCGLNIEQITWHDARSVQSLGEIAGLRMHRWVVESRFLITIGSVEPHYFAGVTGPHKTATIGCMSFEDIERNHAGALHPGSDILHLQGNPVHDGIVDALRRLQASGKMICALGEVVCGEALLAAAAGDPIAVVDALLPTVRRTYMRRIPKQVDVLRLRVPPPLGRNFYQADKAVKNNHRAVRDGGGIILQAECPEGVGPDAFVNLLRRASDYDMARRIVAEEGYRLGDHKAVHLRRLMDPVCRGVHVAVVSAHLTTSDMQGTGLAVFHELEPATTWLAKVVRGPLLHGLIVEDAGVLSVFCENKAL